jgi:anti-sigma B factor antagonist
MIALDSAQLFVGATLRPERVTTLYLDGEITERELLHLGNELFRLAQRNTRHIILDFSEVSHLDYRGVRPLSSRAEVFRRGGGDIKLSGLSPYLLAIFRAAGAHDAFEFFPTSEQAKLAVEQSLIS